MQFVEFMEHREMLNSIGDMAVRLGDSPEIAVGMLN